MSPYLQIMPIHVIFFYAFEKKSWGQLPAYMLSAVILNRRSYSAVLLSKQPIHQRSTLFGPLVLAWGPLIFLLSTVDRDQTVSRRSKPNSRTTLFGEQTNPWDLLQPQDVMSRHRGAKQLHRYELLRVISLLSPAYLLSVERWPLHNGPPDHYNPQILCIHACLACLPYSQASIYYYALQLIFFQFELAFAHLRYSLGGDRPSQTTNHSSSPLFITCVSNWVKWLNLKKVVSQGRFLFSWR